MDKRIGDVRHFKLASGDEVICEVIEWNDPYSDDATRQEEIVIRKAVKMVFAKSTTGFPFYTMRPFMVYQESLGSVISLNSYHVVSMAKPPEHLLLQWEEALLDMNANYEDRVRSWKDAEAALREGKIQDYVDGLVEKTKEEVEEAADKLGKLLFFPILDPDKDKLH